MNLNPWLFYSLKIISPQAVRPRQRSPLRYLGPHHVKASFLHTIPWELAARRLDNLVPYPPTITLPFLGLIIGVREECSLQVCTFQLQHLEEEPSAEPAAVSRAGRGQRAEQVTCHLGQPPSLHPGLSELWTELDRTPSESTNSGSLEQPRLGVFISGVLGMGWEWQGSERLETLTNDLTLARYVYLPYLWEKAYKANAREGETWSPGQISQSPE